MIDKKDIKLRKSLFWDVDIEKLDIDKYPAYVLQRVLEYGTWEEWKQFRSYYSMELIKETVMNLRTLRPDALSYIAIYTDTNIEDYRCYKFAQLHPTLWNS